VDTKLLEGFYEAQSSFSYHKVLSQLKENESLFLNLGVGVADLTISVVLVK
jgi:hypothetical protein